MAEDFDPYYLWLGIPPRERPANHYRLLGVPVFEENPSVIESAADRQMAHLRSVQAGKHSALSQRLLNEVAAAKVCLLRPPQKAKYDQALRAKLESQAATDAAAGNSAAGNSAVRSAAVTSAAPGNSAISNSAVRRASPAAAPQAKAEPIARAQPLAASEPAKTENFWDDLTAAAPAAAAPKTAKPLAKAAAPPPSKLKKFWPVFLALGACLLVVAVIIAVRSMGQGEGPTGNPDAAVAPAPKPKDSSLVFDWPADARSGMTLSVDGAKLNGPADGPWEYHVPPGTHHIVASRPGFKPIDRLVDAPVDGKRHITDAWQPLATLVLHWPVEDRDGAVLNLDGQILTAGIDQPLTLPVEPGAHTVRITRLGYLPLEENITVAADQHQDLAVSLQPTSATLVVRWPISQRAGAEVQVDGQPSPKVKTSNDEKIAFELDPGSHTIQIKRPGFEPFSQTVVLAAAGKKQISPAWTSSNPAGNETASSSSDAPPAGDTKPHGSDSPPAAKHPIPSETDQARVAKQLEQIYKPSHDPAKDLSQAKELCNLALKSEQVPERYMLLLKGADFAVDGGDFSLAMEAVETLDAEFEISPLDVKQKLLEKLVKAPLNEQQANDSISAAERLVEEAIAAERYDAATTLAGIASKLLVKKGIDPDSRRDAEKILATDRTQIKTLQPQLELAQKAKQTLAAKPDDADANGVLGRWYCYYKSDWKTGLPYLAKSGNERVAPTAKLELQEPRDSAKKVQLADQWWDIGAKESAAVADAIHLHAGDLYREALPNLSSVLQKAAVEKRLAEVMEIRSRVGDVGGHSGPVVFQRGRWVDVLKLVDVDRDSNGGSWTRKGNEFSCRNSSRLFLPIVIDGGYDLEVDFSRVSDVGAEIHTVFPVGKHLAGLTLSAYKTYSGFDSVNNRRPWNVTPYSPYNFFLQDNHRYQEVISVRLGKGGVASVDISVDGQRLLPHWEGDPNNLGLNSRTFNPPTDRPAIEATNPGSATLYAVRLRMVSGQGRSDDQKSGSSGDPSQPSSPNFPSRAKN